MLDYTILNKKKKYKINNDEALDLLSSDFPINYAKLTGSVIIVNKYYVARPDLISLAVYGDDKYADFNCKVNFISNPFELNENMVLMIPSINYIADNTSYDSLKSDFIKSGDDEIKELKNDQKKVNERRSPNEQTYGENNFVIDHSLGLVFY